MVPPRANATVISGSDSPPNCSTTLPHTPRSQSLSAVLTTQPMGSPTTSLTVSQADLMPSFAASNAPTIRVFSESTGVMIASRSRDAAPAPQDTKLSHSVRAAKQIPDQIPDHHDRIAFIPVTRTARSDAIAPSPHAAS